MKQFGINPILLPPRRFLDFPITNAHLEARDGVHSLDGDLARLAAYFHAFVPLSPECWSNQSKQSEDGSKMAQRWLLRGQGEGGGVVWDGRQTVASAWPRRRPNSRRGANYSCRLQAQPPLIPSGGGQTCPGRGCGRGKGEEMEDSGGVSRCHY